MRSATPLPARPRSLRLRLLVGTLVWVAVSLIAAGWGLDRLFRAHVGEQFEATLSTHLDQLTAAFAVDTDGRPQLAVTPPDPRLGQPYGGLYWQVDRLPAAGTESRAGVLRSRSLWDATLAVPADALADGELHWHRIAGPQGEPLGMVERSVRLADDAGPAWRLVVAADERFWQEPVSRFTGALWLALGLLGAGLIVAVLVQVAVGLAPLDTLRDALARVRDGRARHLEGDFPGELAPLVDEFNSVLDENAAVVERARTAAGNLAHALKTPLSVLANAAAARTDPLAQLVVDQVAGARRHVDYHLAQAHAAAAARRPGSRTPLAPTLDGLLRAMRQLHAGRDLQLTPDLPAPCPAFAGDPQDLQEMLGNLLDNACKWAGQRVDVSARGAGGQLTLTVDDDGPGLAAERREAVLGRGIRADERVPGSGLGLAIALDLARVYGGDLQLGGSPLGGLRATLTLPAAAAE